ncbi:MAG: type II toxin-antitoxin system HicB family antitoxin [Comamonadaceae bacterium]|nr:type II toxin-antitoxin system HicB family antitoxin [Comamonadaceae bacterium]
MLFSVVLHSDNGQNYGVTVPDLPGCYSAGSDLDDAMASAKEAIEFHVESSLEAGLSLPLREPITVHQANPDFANGIWAVVDVPVEKYLGPAEKINITVPALILARIDEYAKRQGLSRSGFLVEAARSAMHA